MKRYSVSPSCFCETITNRRRSFIIDIIIMNVVENKKNTKKDRRNETSTHDAHPGLRGALLNHNLYTRLYIELPTVCSVVLLSIPAKTNSSF